MLYAHKKEIKDLEKEKAELTKSLIVDGNKKFMSYSIIMVLISWFLIYFSSFGVYIVIALVAFSFVIFNNISGYNSINIIQQEIKIIELEKEIELLKDELHKQKKGQK